MSCDDTLRRLDDLLDGTLDGPERERVQAHLASCPSCWEELAKGDRLRRLTAELPRSVEPRHDLWPGIAGRLRPRQAASRRRRLTGPVLAIAAVLVLAVVAGLAFFVGRAQAPSRVVRVPEAGDVLRAGNGGVSLGAAQAEILEARDALRTAVAARRGELSPQTLRIVDENLRLIDDAIARITVAIESNPDNPELTRRLAAAYRQQIDLLQRVARLPADA